MIKTRSIKDDDPRRSKAYRLLRRPHAGAGDSGCVGPRAFAWGSASIAAAVAQRSLAEPTRPRKREVLHEYRSFEHGLVDMDTTGLDPFR